MGIQERKQREREQRISQIIDAAEKVFCKVGMDHATMDEVANECELSKATLYIYFKNKEELFAALALRGLERLNDLFRISVKEYDHAPDKVRALGRAYLEFYRERPENYLMINHQGSSDSCATAIHENVCQEILRSEWFGRLLTAEKALWETCFAVTEEGVVKGAFKLGTNPREVVAMLWASSNGIFQLMEHIRTHERYLKMLPDAHPFEGIDPVELYIKNWEYILDSIVVNPEQAAEKRIIWNGQKNHEHSNQEASS